MPRASTAAHDRVIASVTRPEAGPARSLGSFGLGDELALLTSRVSAVAAALLRRGPDTTPTTARRSRRAGPWYLRPGGVAAFATMFHRVRSRGPIVPTLRPFARRCCRTSGRRRSLWPCKETTPREAVHPLHGGRRPH